MVAKRLIERSDVLLATLRPGALDRIGLDYETCAELNRRLVYAIGSTYGLAGELASRPGVDLLAQAMGDVVSKTGTPEQPMPTGSTHDERARRPRPLDLCTHQRPRIHIASRRRLQ
ncbi:MAG: Crotonobetainyl-CoA:carnitine CoA-transferase CaiB [Chloroflexi bacterium]|jgi:crotonobetainyl-CoA:carnitine CoA-transferase CaiB-like acyl-CoA transferase|nr:MAG: Crotonobetainyl-CoA:carnitine CoA-transferase CaiB [Chloroflexota bacterium]